MKTPIPIYLAVEDDLSEIMLRRILRARPVEYVVSAVFKHGGFGYLKKQTQAFNNMAKACPVLMLTDLDQLRCAPELIEDWLKQPKHPDFLLRVAVREVEAWLLACDEPLGKYLRTRQPFFFHDPEALGDPKLELLKLAERSSRRDIREAIARRDTGGNLRQGPAYNSVLSAFVDQIWKPKPAATKCPSLKRVIKALGNLEAGWKDRHS